MASVYHLKSTYIVCNNLVGLRSDTSSVMLAEAASMLLRWEMMSRQGWVLGKSYSWWNILWFIGLPKYIGYLSHFCTFLVQIWLGYPIYNGHGILGHLRPWVVKPLQLCGQKIVYIQYICIARTKTRSPCMCSFIFNPFLAKLWAWVVTWEFYGSSDLKPGD